MCYYVKLPAVEKRQGLFDVKSVELYAHSRLEGDGTDFDDVIEGM